MEVIADDHTIEAELLGEDAVAEELGGRELLRGRFPAECQHDSDILGGERLMRVPVTH
jgi:hypothetical protein